MQTKMNKDRWLLQQIVLWNRCPFCHPINIIKNFPAFDCIWKNIKNDNTLISVLGSLLFIWLIVAFVYLAHFPKITPDKVRPQQLFQRKLLELLMQDYYRLEWMPFLLPEQQSTAVSQHGRNIIPIIISWFMFNSLLFVLPINHVKICWFYLHGLLWITFRKAHLQLHTPEK